MSLSELLTPPSPDGAQDASTARATSLMVDPSLGGATRTNADAGSTLDNLLLSVGKAVRETTVNWAVNTPTGAAIAAEARAAYVNQQWSQWAPFIVLGMVAFLVVLLFRRA
jgi:hypothetical protein